MSLYNYKKLANPSQVRILAISRSKRLEVLLCLDLSDFFHLFNDNSIDDEKKYLHKSDGTAIGATSINSYSS
ncbi:hypothetical protein [Okeania sp. SIO1I7]|uniref:hypothetical protein n=1 Tax=Okeania sp. SIO1I7 TaxID=2607772 RepID=UPI0013FC83E9|nr:hypothetical protein [Okeania sp. SIO1I7]NET27085.1 hypothetical protein [Okeania sp. SIO1I7]